MLTRNCYIFQMNPLYNLTTCYHMDLFWYYPPIYTQVSQVISTFQVTNTTFFAFVMSLTVAAFFAHFSLLNVITLIKFIDGYKLRRSLLCSSLCPPIIPSVSYFLWLSTTLRIWLTHFLSYTNIFFFLERGWWWWCNLW